jgi:sulfate adenylyltransferase
MRPFLELRKDQYFELEKLALGAFAPLHGFMNEKEFRSVVKTMRLPSGDVFSLPVLLDIDEDTAKTFKAAAEVDLYFESKKVGVFFPSDFYSCDRSAVAQQIFGTDNKTHPGVSFFYGLKPIFAGGAVKLLCRISSDELTPDETKKIFKDRGWKRVVGFQTRNIPHRAHEYLLRIALETADGIFVQPLIGRKRAGDFTPEAVIQSYRNLIENFLPSERVVLSTLTTFMRYAGPREALFHAIIRRNYGCSHFIVGRDHAGVGNWYGLYAAQDLTKQFEKELGIKILNLKGPFFCRKCNGIATENSCSHSKNEIQEISGSLIRSILDQGRSPDTHLMRQEIVDCLKGLQLFIE